MGRLTTHILNTAQGCPAAGVAIRLFAAEGERRLVASTASNADGRTDAPLVEGAAMATGCYELEFDVGPYFACAGVNTGEPAVPRYVSSFASRCSRRALPRAAPGVAVELYDVPGQLNAVQRALR